MASDIVNSCPSAMPILKWRIAIIPHVGNSMGHLLRAIALQRALHELADTLLIIPDKAKEFIDCFFPGSACKWVPWNFGHSEITQLRLTEAVSNSKITASEITNILNEFVPDFVIGLPGFYTSILCRMIGVPHVSVLHGAWLAPNYELADLQKAEKIVIDKSLRAFEVLDIVTKIIVHALGARYTDYRTWLQEEMIWEAQGFSVETKGTRLRIGFLSADFGVLDSSVPANCLSVTVGTGIKEVKDELILALSREKEQVVVVAESRPSLTGKVIWKAAVPCSELAKRSCLGISHGGVSTVGAYAAAGVPQLLLPHDLDQSVTSILATRSGYGKVIDLKFWRERTPFGRFAPSVQATELQRLIAQCKKQAAPNRVKLNDADLIREAVSQVKI
jgi:UDP-N-acetylglucosamine:LPS N-acetylglucosamine transferase